MEVTVKKLRKPAIVHKIAPSGNSELAGRKIVGVASVAKCWRQNAFAGICTLSEYFPSSFILLRFFTARRYTSAVYAVVVCTRLFVCLTV